jgi:hypothetical protein
MGMQSLRRFIRASIFDWVQKNAKQKLRGNR